MLVYGMQIKRYRNKKEMGYAGQNINSWSNRWYQQPICKTGDKDYLSYYFKKYLPKFPAKILEGGCGLGKYVIAYRKLGYDIMGVDFSKYLIDRIKEYDDLPVYVANIKNLPFESEYFDCYISTGVLEHFEYDIDEPIKEAYRVLKSGGLFLITVPYINIIRRIISNLYKKGGVFCEYYFDEAEISNILINNGFKIKNIHPVNFLWGEIGSVVRPFKKIVKSKLIYNLIIKEDRSNMLFDFILSLLNRIAGNMIFIVAYKK